MGWGFHHDQEVAIPGQLPVAHCLPLTTLLEIDTSSVVIADSELESAGFDVVLHKPFELKIIADSIARFHPQSG
jgi:hypothetical protein